MPTPRKKISAESISLRINVIDPPPNVLWALQLGRDELVKPSSVSKGRISFEFPVEVLEDPSTGIRLRGPAIQGRPGERFVYLCIGTYAGQTGTTVARRAKVRLDDITSKLVAAARARPSGVLEVQFAGTDSKGGAACATVPLLAGGWHVA